MLSVATIIAKLGFSEIIIKVSVFVRLRVLCRWAVCVPAFMMIGCFAFRGASAFKIPQEQLNQIKKESLLEDVTRWAEKFDKLEDNSRIRAYIQPLKRGLVRKLYDIGDNPYSASAVADNNQAIEVAARNILAENNIIFNLDDPLDREFIGTLFGNASVKDVYAVYKDELGCYEDEIDKYNKPIYLLSREARCLKQAWGREGTPRRIIFDETCFPISVLNRSIFKPILKDDDGSFFEAQSGLRIIAKKVAYDPVPECVNDNGLFNLKNEAMKATLSVVFHKSCSMPSSTQNLWSFFPDCEHEDIFRSKSRDNL